MDPESRELPHISAEHHRAFGRIIYAFARAESQHRGAFKVLGSTHNEKEWTAEELHVEADFMLERISELKHFLAKRGLFPEHGTSTA